MRYECEHKSKKLSQSRGEYRWEVEAVKTQSHEAAAKIRGIPQASSALHSTPLHMAQDDKN